MSTKVLPIIVVHGGVGAPADFVDGCATAASEGQRVLQAGGSALDAVVTATRVLEDDDRFNAGHGANYRLDGRTRELDASVMASDGRYAGVGAVQDVPNPVLLARHLLDLPPRFVVGEGATLLARRLGLAGTVRPTPRARQRHAEIAALAASGRLHEEYAPWRGIDPHTCWNFPTPPPDFAAIAASSDAEPSTGAGDRASDTVGAVARDASGLMAAASSTGGTALMLYGRIGDSPLIGCGLYAGPAGAVTVTGEGEEIVVRLLSKRVYDWLEDGIGVDEACRRGVALFDARTPVGVIAITSGAASAYANRSMPWASSEEPAPPTA